MSKILENLYVGSVDDAFNNDIIYNITHILNIADELDINERIDHEYLKCGCNDDDLNDNIQRILPGCIEWITKAIKSKGKILVHCLEGKKSFCLCYHYIFMSY